MVKHYEMGESKAALKSERVIDMREQISVSFKSVDDVSRFVKILSKFDNDFDLYCGAYCVDAKSLLGILTMDLRKTLLLKGNCDKEEQKVLEKELSGFAVA